MHEKEKGKSRKGKKEKKTNTFTVSNNQHLTDEFLQVNKQAQT